MRHALLLVLLLGGCAQGVASAQAGATCGTVAWGGWTGSPRCAALAARPILGRDLDRSARLAGPTQLCRVRFADDSG